jgi:hypothetical protein
MDRNNFDWQKEVAYGYHNLAVLQEGRQDYEGAEHAMKRELELFRGWVKERPKDLVLRSEEAAILSWLGTNAEGQKRFADAETWYFSQLEIFDELRRADPANADYRKEWVDAQLLLAQARFKLGDFDNARVAVDAAIREADAMVRQDPENRTWRSQQAIARYWSAAITGVAQPRQAVPVAREAERILADLVAAEPKNARVADWLERTHELQAQLANSEVATR